MAAMDDMLEKFRRQYLQQVQPATIRYPPTKVLIEADIQQQIYRHFFDDTNSKFLPHPEYQRRVLKKLIMEIERELNRGQYDKDEFLVGDFKAVSDELMSHMGALSALPRQDGSESAQQIRTLSYFTPISLKSFLHNDHRILIRESPNLLAAGSNVGLRTWEACLRLAYYLCSCPTLAKSHHDNKDLQGSSVLELGAGTGLLSLICAHNLGASHVVSTDGLTHVVEGIQANIEMNQQNSSKISQSTIVATVLDWTRPEDLSGILEKNGKGLSYDYILGADITYHPELFDPLAGILKTLKIMFPKARILIAATVRNETTLRSFHQVCTANHGLMIRDIKENEWQCPSYLDQTGLFHEQAFPITIMDIDLP